MKTGRDWPVNSASHSLSLDHARFSGSLLENAAGSGIERITSERLLQRIGTATVARARNNHVPGHWHALESAVTDLLHCFQNAAQIRLWTAFVCEMWARVC